ncbi:MAG: glycerophosphodiester phosphodiesterase family protein [Bacteroidota bacterium]
MQKKYLCLILILVLNFSCQNSSKIETEAVTEEVTTDVQINRSGALFSRLTSLGDSNILVCAHRAFHRDYPENSIPAIRQAMRVLIDLVEIDIRTSKDGVLVIMHDETIDRTTTGSGKVTEMTLEELKEVNLLYRDEKETDIKMPTLEEVFSTFSGKRIFFDLDIKDADLEQLVAMIQKYDMEEQVMCYNSKKEVHEQLLTLEPNIITLPLCEDRERIDFYLQNLDPLVLHYTGKSYNDELLPLAKENNVNVFINALWEIDEAFTTGDQAPLEELLSKQPNIIQTDYPVLVLEYLRVKGMHE